MKIKITHIDTACMLLDINGYRILTDPVLDKAGRIYHHGFGSVSRKIGSPVIGINELKNIDLILLSHHQHKDNFDPAGRAFALTVPRMISTKPASRAMKGITGLDNWEFCAIGTDKVPGLKITATPAQHRPGWLPEFFSGKVIGFILQYDGQEKGAIYISGDTVYFKGIEEIAGRFTIDTAILHAGSVQFRYLSGLGKYTMDSNDLLQCVRVLNPNTVIPVHSNGWTHFKEKEPALKQVLTTHALSKDRTLFLRPGEEQEI